MSNTPRTAARPGAAPRAARLVMLAGALLATMAAGAQEDPEYRAEIGGGLGLVTYQGDFSGSLTKNAQPLFAAMGKYRLNPRMALGLRVSHGKLKGSSGEVKTWYPGIHDNAVDFSNAVTDASVTYEYNFWPYGTGREYRGAQPLTPYIVLGLGLTVAKNSGGTVVATNLPIGLGVKYKLAERLNLSVEWLMHFTTSDKLDGVADPYGIKSGGMFKNTDSYSMLQVSLSYDIWAKCKTCNNDRD